MIREIFPLQFKKAVYFQPIHFLNAMSTLLLKLAEVLLITGRKFHRIGRNIQQRVSMRLKKRSLLYYIRDSSWNLCNGLCRGHIGRCLRDICAKVFPVSKTISDLQRTFFRMKRNFEKKQKNIAREYSMERKEGENSCYITAARYICQSHICQWSFHISDGNKNSPPFRITGLETALCR